MRRKALVLAAALLLAFGVFAPAHAEGPDPLYPVLQPVDLLTGWLAPENTSALMPDPAASRYFMPDWNNNGVFGEDADLKVDLSGAETIARFRYPCVDLNGNVTYETTAGQCMAADTPGATFRTGEARRLHFIAADGYRLAATLLVPDDVAGPLPGLVFANGGIAPGRMYYAYTMTAARRGYIGLDFDFSGYGDSEGSFFDSAQTGGDAGPCLFYRQCRELQDAVRWFTGAPIVPASTLDGTHDPAYLPDGENPYNPALDRLDITKVAVEGQSGGSHMILNYPWWQAKGVGIDGQPLPPISAAIALSGFPPTKAVVPIQAQTADFDIPFAGQLGERNANGPIGTKTWYDSLRNSGEGAGELEFLVIESGSHGDTTNLPWLPRVEWSLALSTTYAVEFLDCHLRDDAAACDRAVAPMPHLSRAVASEHDPDGPAGPSPSRCITIPDRATLGQAPAPANLVKALTGKPPYDCTP